MENSTRESNASLLKKCFVLPKKVNADKEKVPFLNNQASCGLTWIPNTLTTFKYLYVATKILSSREGNVKWKREKSSYFNDIYSSETSKMCNLHEVFSPLHLPLGKHRLTAGPVMVYPGWQRYLTNSPAQLLLFMIIALAIFTGLPQLGRTKRKVRLN